jgi:hypothetical protein
MQSDTQNNKYLIIKTYKTKCDAESPLSMSNVNHIRVLVGEDGANEIWTCVSYGFMVQPISIRHTCVVDLARAGINSLEQLIDFIVGHLLSEIRKDCHH